MLNIWKKIWCAFKTQESDLDINQLEIVLDGKSLISANMRDIHRKLYDIYDFSFNNEGREKICI
nr:hypothetical protein [Clostridioides difficile]